MACQSRGMRALKETPVCQSAITGDRWFKSEVMEPVLKPKVVVVCSDGLEIDIDINNYHNTFFNTVYKFKIDYFGNLETIKINVWYPGYIMEIIFDILHGNVIVPHERDEESILWVCAVRQFDHSYQPDYSHYDTLSYSDEDYDDSDSEEFDDDFVVAEDSDPESFNDSDDEWWIDY